MNPKETEQIVRSLQESIASLQSDESYRRYLSLLSRFHTYSFRNTLLIYRQMPSATYVAGYQTWIREFERHVRKGEKGIRIFAPCRCREDPQEIAFFRCISVFDISQTEGRPLNAFISEKIQGTIEDEDAFLHALFFVCPVEVRERKDMDIHGCYDPKAQCIYLKEGMEKKLAIRTLIHEIAHASMHTRSSLSRRTKEVEAESVAYTVCAHYGLDTSPYSFGYIAGWMEEENSFEKSMHAISETSSALIQQLDQLLIPKVSAHVLMPKA